MGVTVDNGTLTDYVVSTDGTTPSGNVQIVRIAQSATGNDNPVAADANGLDVDITRLPGSTIGIQTAVNVGTAATLVIAANATRKTVTIRPGGLIYIGYTNTVTTATGTPVYGTTTGGGELWEDDIFKGAIYAIAAAGSIDTRVIEAQ